MDALDVGAVVEVDDVEDVDDVEMESAVVLTVDDSGDVVAVEVPSLLQDASTPSVSSDVTAMAERTLRLMERLH